MEQKRKRIEELVNTLNEASYAYYNGLDEIMPNYEWDALLDELESLEKETGIILPESPTQTVDVAEDEIEGKEEEHEFPMLSLPKSKDVSVLQKWAGERPIWLSWKLDGLTLVCTYNDGKLTKLVTRGKGGLVGKNITHLAPYIKNIPKKIKDSGHLVLRGETVISYEDFESINSTLEKPYENPRNLVSGTLGLKKNRAAEAAERGAQYIGFTLVYCEKRIQSWGERMDYIKELGFNPVEHELTDAAHLPEVIERWTKKVQDGKMNIPVDGFVIVYDDTDYAAQGSVTGHHATNAGFAFKWPDKPEETTLRDVEWSCATNCISPVAIFDPVALEGTTVKRASLCNISEMERLGIGELGKTKLEVIKANMIIPKCIKAQSNGTTFKIPSTCPVCGAPTEVRISQKTNTKTLHCTNNNCVAKNISKFKRFVSKDGFDIDGLSMKTMEKFINKKFIHSFSDLLFELDEHEDAIKEMEGFGTKAYANMMAAIEKAIDKVDYAHFMYAFSIPMIGHDATKKILNAIGSDEMERRLEEGLGFEDIEGIGPEKSNSFLNWYVENKEEFLYIRSKVGFLPALPKKSGGKFTGKTFVITGSVEKFKNRGEIKALIESEGGKVSGSVSKNTDYLINNDTESSSSKNKKAKELGIPIINEDDFIAM